MCSLRLKKSNLFIASFILLATSSCGKFFPCCNEIEIPCHWHIPMKNGLNEEDPQCFIWWEALGDPLLNELIEEGICNNFDVRLAATQSEEKKLQAENSVATDIARNYIELNCEQEKLKIINKQIQLQKASFTLTEGLSQTGFVDIQDENEKKFLLDLLYIEKSSTELAINKAIFHISTLLNYPPAHLYELLYFSKKTPTLPTFIPIGNPRDLVERHPSVQEAKNQYELSGNIKAFYNYQKTILTVLENTENALATLQAESQKNQYLLDRKKIKDEAYHLTNDLYQRGLKGETDAQATLQDLLSEEKACIEGNTNLLIDYVNLEEFRGTPSP